MKEKEEKKPKTIELSWDSENYNGVRKNENSFRFKFSTEKQHLLVQQTTIIYRRVSKRWCNVVLVYSQAYTKCKNSEKIIELTLS